MKHGYSKDIIKPFSASDKGSFAEFTIRERFPKIFKEVCSEEYDKFISETTVYNGIANAAHTGVMELKKEVEPYNTMLIKDFFYSQPFLLVEFYFYHLLLSRRNYGNLQFDFFAHKKDSSYKDKGKEYAAKLKDLFEKKEDENIYNAIKNIFQFSLTANTGDLSQLKEEKSKTVNVLCDQTDIGIKYIIQKQYKRFDIICDNSGDELFSDIYLAVFFIIHKFTKKVILHLKPCPFFVSDATLDDFSKLLALLTADAKNQELFALLHTKQIEIAAEDFWVEPYCFDKMPKKLRKSLNKSDLIFIKGDLNYRRLIKDYNWNFTETLNDRSLLKDVPVILPRVLKSDLLIGVDPVFEAFARNSDSKYRTSGKWGVIQTTIKANKKNIPIRVKNNKTGKDRNKEKNIQNKNKEKNIVQNKLHYIVLVLTSLVLIVILISTVCISCNKDYKVDIKAIDRIDFSIILTALTLLVSGSIFLPKFLLETKINASIEQLVPKIVKEKTYQCISHEISSVNNKINKVDAHLSRMIAFSLYEQYPIWSIGWSFRSLKKYIKLDTKSVGFAEYTDFITFIQKGILESAIHSFNKKIKAIENQAYFAVLQEEADRISEPNPVRPSIRAIKDIVDFEYEIFFTETIEDDDKILILKNICNNTGTLTKNLCIILMDYYNTQSNPFNKEEADKNLLLEILKISDYGNYCKNLNYQKDYKEKLSNLLGKLKHEKIIVYQLETRTTFFI